MLQIPRPGRLAGGVLVGSVLTLSVLSISAKSSLPVPDPVCSYTSAAAPPRTVTTAVTEAPPATTVTAGMRAEVLQNDINDYYYYTLCLYNLNNFGGIATSVAVIIIALMSTVAAQFATAEVGSAQRSWKNWSVFSSALTTALAAVQIAFPFADRANFNRNLNTRTDALLSQM